MSTTLVLKMKTFMAKILVMKIPRTSRKIIIKSNTLISLRNIIVGVILTRRNIMSKGMSCSSSMHRHPNSLILPQV